MRRTQVLLEVPIMRFEEAYGGWQEGRLTQQETARLLLVWERTFRRQINPYEDEGIQGLIDKRLAQVCHRRAPVDVSPFIDTEGVFRDCTRDSSSGLSSATLNARIKVLTTEHQMRSVLT